MFIDGRDNLDLVRAVAANDETRAEVQLRQGSSASFILREWGDQASLGIRFVRRIRNAKETETPVLYVAAKLKTPSMIRLLLRYGADPNARFHAYFLDDGCRIDEEWENCLGAGFPDVETVSVLLQAGANPTLCWGDGPGLELGLAAVAAGHPQILDALRRYGPPPNDGGGK